MILKENIFERKIIPNKLITNSSFYYIDITSSYYTIDEYIVYTNESGNIEKIIISKGNHPNCNRKNKEFCIPDFIKQIKLNDETLKIIEDMLKIFNFESAYYHPWYAFDIKEKSEGVLDEQCY